MDALAETTRTVPRTGIDEERVIRTAYLLSVVSGAAALVYQVAWVKMISLSLGSTTIAAGAVIGSFMAGMGIGARLYDTVFRRHRHAFKLYAGLEFGIALSTATITLSLYSLPQFYAGIYRAIGGGPVLMAVTRFVFVFLLLLVPSALMGATFPALCTALIRSASGVGKHLGMIYGLNTLGAALGSVAAGFILIEAVGNQASTWIANLCNLLIAATALWLFNQVKGSELDEPPPPDADSALTSALPKVIVGAVLVGSGFSTMAYEAFWIRGLKYIVGNSTYAISMVLVIFLAGLGIGGVLFRRIAARQRPERDLGFCQLAIALFALGAVGLAVLLQTLPWFARNVSIFSLQVEQYPWPFRLMLASVVSIVLLLVPTIFMGLSFPLASRLYIEDVRRLGAGVGTAYLLANIGSILGVTLGATLLLPALGTAGATKVVGAVNLTLGLMILVYLGGWTAARAGGVVVTLGLVAALASVIPARIPFQGQLENEATKIAFWEEGDLGTVKVVTDPALPDYQVMTIDGYVIGNAGRTDILGYKQQLLAHLPMLLVPHARCTLNIGLGSGSTLATLATYPDIEVLDCVEIIPEVVEGARLFKPFAALDDERVHLHVDDAVHFLLTTDRQYDLIIADGKQNPKFSGNAVMLSEEFQRYCLDRLTDDGILIEWLSPTLPTRTFEAAVRSFCAVFPEVEAYYVVPSAVGLVGSKKPILPDPADWPLRFATNQAREQLREYNIESPYALLAAHVSGGESLKSAVGLGEHNTWDHPILEFIAYKEFHAKTHAKCALENLTLLRKAAKPCPVGSSGNALAEQFLRSGRLLQDGYIAMMETRDAERLRPYVQDALRVNPRDTLARAAKAKIPRGFLGAVEPDRP